MISVIVPAYNAEKTIERCIRSIAAQTFKNIEIIVINDGSTDNTEDRIKSLCLEFQYLRVFSQPNQGLSAARNKGIDESNGELLAFVDADDCIAPSMLEKLYDALEDTGAAISVCGFKKVYEPFEISMDDADIKTNVAINTANAAEALYNINGKESNIGLFGVEAWNKLYKKELFNQIRFPVGMIYEDNFIMHKLFHKAAKIAYVKLPLYFYVQTEGSIVHSDYSDKKFDGLAGFENRIAFFAKYYPQLVSVGMEYYLRILISHYHMAVCSKDNKNIRRVRSKYRFIFRRRLKRDFRIRSRYWLFYLSPSFYIYLSMAEVF